MRLAPKKLTLILATLLVTGIAHAEPTPEDRTLARSLFDEGRALAKDGHFAEACPKLQESERLDPGIGTLFNLGDCFEHLGRMASAWSAFSEAADLAKHAGQPDREGVARDRAAALMPQLAKIRMRIAGGPPPGLELSLDGKKLSVAVIDAEMPVDPGEHKVGASAPGKIASETVTTARPSATVLVDIPALVDSPVAVAPIPPSAPPAGGSAAPPVDAAPQPEHGLSWEKKAAFIAGGAAVIGLGFGTVFGLEAQGQWSDAKAHCVGSVCDSVGYPKWSDAHTSATVSTVSFTAGAVLAAAAVVLFVLSPSAESAPRSAAMPLGVTF